MVGAAGDSGIANWCLNIISARWTVNFSQSMASYIRDEKCVEHR